MRSALALAILLLGTGAVPALAASPGERLEEIRREIEEREQRARSFREEAEGYFEELEGIDREVAEARRSQRRLRERKRHAEEELELARAGLAEAAFVAKKTRKDLQTRLVALYKFGSQGGIPALYSAQDFQTFTRRRHDMGRVLEQDARLFDRHRVARIAWVRSRDESQRLVDEIDEARHEIEARNLRISRDSVERHNLVALLRSRSEHESKAAAELKRAARRLEEAVAKMPADFVPPSGAGLERGGVGWPVAGPVRIGFGRQVDPEFRTMTRRSGIEIEAARGVPVLAVATGRVLFAGWFRGYGQLIILDHGNDLLTVSGYLDEISVEKGSAVQEGQTIGTVGETGSLAGPGLYFEIRHKRKPVDPRAWLSPRGTEGT